MKKTLIAILIDDKGFEKRIKLPEFRPFIKIPKWNRLEIIPSRENEPVISSVKFTFLREKAGGGSRYTYLEYKQI